VLSDLENDKIAARKAGQFTVAVRASELQGKYLAMFTDRVEHDTTAIREYTEAERLEGKRVAALLVKDVNQPLLPAKIDSQHNESQVGTNEQEGQNSGRETPLPP
jgi:hypothetical protein